MEKVARHVLSNDGNDDASARILDDIHLTVPRGGLLHVVGPSGAGKSSLIRLINRLDEATAGRIEVLGRPLETWPPRDLRRCVAMVFQEPSLLGLTIRENLQLPFHLNGPMPHDIDARIEQALNLAALEATLLDRDAAQLSVGQKQRATLARALITEPQILLLDEPTAGLDARAAEQLLQSVADLRRTRAMSIVMVTHRITEARMLGGDMLVLIDGRIAAKDEAERLLAAPPAGAVGELLRNKG